VANGLGTLSYPGMPIESFGDEVDEYQVMHEIHVRRSELLVVNDPSTVNAMQRLVCQAHHQASL